jgi:poly(A) polymerase
MSRIIDELCKLNATVVCLQECSQDEEAILCNNRFIKENYYVCSTNKSSSSVCCIILSKSKPKWFHVVKLIENSSKCALIIEFEIWTNQTTKPASILLACAHLTSDMSTDAYSKRRQQLKSLVGCLESIESQNDIDCTIIAGDFNIGNDQYDADTIDIHLISYQFHDLAPNCFSFDPFTNLTASITSTSRQRRRIDRIYLKTSKPYTIKAAELFNTNPLEINAKNRDFFYEPYSAIVQYFRKNSIAQETDDATEKFDTTEHNRYLHPSDHYGLHVKIQFTDSLDGFFDCTHHSVLAVLVPKSSSELIQNIRRSHDRTFDRWPPHINIIYPFYRNIDTENVSVEVFNALSSFEPFDVSLNELCFFQDNSVVYMKPTSDTRAKLSIIHSRLRQLFSDLDTKGIMRDKYEPHLTVAQLEEMKSKTKRRDWAKNMHAKLIAEHGASLSIRFTVDCLYWLTRKGTEPFKTKFTFPLGERFPFIRTGLYISSEINWGILGFLNDNNMLLPESGLQMDLVSGFNHLIKQLNDNLARLDNCETKHVHMVYTMGSFLFGINTHDIDLAIVKLQPTGSDCCCPYQQPLGVYVNALARELSANEDYHTTRNIPDALAPIIELTLSDCKENTGLLTNHIDTVDIQLYEVPLDLYDLFSSQCKTNYKQYMKILNRKQTGYTELYLFSGIFENTNTKAHISHYKDFQVLLSFVKLWAQSKGIYGKAFGFIGGCSFAILVAYFLSKHVDSESLGHQLELDNSNQRFTCLVVDFFQFFANFDWSNNVVSLVDQKTVEQVKQKYPEQLRKTPISILQSVCPYHNTSRNVTDRYAKIIVHEFRRAHAAILDWKHLHDENDARGFYGLCTQLCKTYELDLANKTFVVFKLFCNNKYDSHHIFSLMKSRTQGLVMNIGKIVDKELRVYPDFVHTDVTNKPDIKFNNLYEYYMCFKNTLRLKPHHKQQIVDLCSGFCTTVYSLCHNSDIEINFVENIEIFYVD